MPSARPSNAPISAAAWRVPSVAVKVTQDVGADGELAGSRRRCRGRLGRTWPRLSAGIARPAARIQAKLDPARGLIARLAGVIADLLQRGVDGGEPGQDESDDDQAEQREHHGKQPAQHPRAPGGRRAWCPDVSRQFACPGLEVAQVLRHGVMREKPSRSTRGGTRPPSFLDLIVIILISVQALDIALDGLAEHLLITALEHHT